MCVGSNTTREKRVPNTANLCVLLARAYKSNTSQLLQTTGQEEYNVVHRPTTSGGGSGGGGTHSAGRCICGGGKHNNQPDNNG